MLFFRLPVRINELVPGAVGPGNASEAVIDRGFNRLFVRGLMMAYPISVSFKASYSVSNISFQVIIAGPVRVQVVGVRFSTLFLAFFYRFF